jgi:hypothetical protein
LEAVCGSTITEDQVSINDLPGATAVSPGLTRREYHFRQVFEFPVRRSPEPNTSHCTPSMTRQTRDEMRDGKLSPASDFRQTLNDTPLCLFCLFALFDMWCWSFDSFATPPFSLLSNRVLAHDTNVTRNGIGKTFGIPFDDNGIRLMEAFD